MRKLLKLPCGAGACDEEGGDALMGEPESGSSQESQAPQQNESDQQADPALLAQVDAVLFWLEQNPASAYPELSDAEYVDMLVGVMAEVGLMESE